jgi:hypothetical protein
MKYKKVVRLYSNSRVAKYYRATNRNKNKAVMLYFANMKIAQAFHPLLSSFEVILRNQLHYALAHHFSDGNWIINQKTVFKGRFCHFWAAWFTSFVMMEMADVENYIS